jgi:drug/metabolite transporter (DMT)-like permease
MSPDAVLWLNAVAVIWGSQHAVIKLVVDDSDASAFSLVRFALAAVVATLPQLLLKKGPPQEQVVSLHDLSDSTFTSPDQQLLATLRWGAELGLWMFLGYAFQAVGLETTTAQRSGFLLYLNVKFVPFFARILFGRKISIPTWISALTAVVGTALLASDESGILALNLNTGDIWSIAAAATSAMFILRLESASKAVLNSASLNATCLWFVTGAALLWALAQGVVDTQSFALSVSQVSSNVSTTLQQHFVELLYLSSVTTALATYIQTKAQRKVSAERASVIYAMDPVYGAIFANVLLGERLEGFGILGAGLITIAAATNAFLDLGAANKDNTL